MHKDNTPRFCVVTSPGYMQDTGRCYSTHRTLELAVRAMGAGYVDECGQRRHSACVVEGYYKKGDKVYSDVLARTPILA